jgi:hypothetical protein
MTFQSNGDIIAKKCANVYRLTGLQTLEPKHCQYLTFTLRTTDCKIE